MKKTNVVTIAFLILTTITLIYDFINNDSEKLFKGIMIYLTVAAAWFVFNKTFLKKMEAVYYIALVFIFFSIYLANLWDFYGIPHYDKFLHFMSGIILALFGLILYMYMGRKNTEVNKHQITIVIFPLFFAIACAGCWETWEFTTDSLFGLHAQNNSLVDTMTDIIAGTIGGGLTSVLNYLAYRGKNIKLIKNIVNSPIFK